MSMFHQCLIQILNALLLQIIVRSINYIQKAENPIPLSPYSNEELYEFKWYEPKKPDDECFTKENLTYEPNNTYLCFPRNNYSNLITCGIGISPKSVSKSRILVIGSTGVIGSSITSELQKQQIPFLEIRSHFQFSISLKPLFKILKQINISSVILLANDEIWEQRNFSYDHIWKFCEKRKITVFKVVQEFDSSLQMNSARSKKFNFRLIQIKSPPVWGPIFLTPYQRAPGRYIHQCIINNSLNPATLDTGKEFVFSLDIAKYIINSIVIQCLNESSQFPNQITIPDFPTISNNELQILLNEKNCKIHSKLTNLSVSELNRHKFNIVWNSLQIEENIGQRQKKKAYATLVVCVSNKKRIIELFSLSLKCTNIIMKPYPNLAIEYLALYCPTDDKKGKFYEVFDIPEELHKFFRIIEIPSSYVNKLKETYNITYFPEFILKNIGIRRASGEYVFSINSDVILPIGFFESVQRKLFTPLSYIRSHRRMVNFRSHHLLLKYYFSVSDVKFQNQSFSDVCRNRRYYDDYDRNGCGDFQGAHIKMWFGIKGFLETSHVFHVDTALSLDFASIPTYMFTRIIGQNIHIVHEKESKITDHFKFYREEFKNAIKQGLSSSMLEGLERPNWGAKGKTFVEY